MTKNPSPSTPLSLQNLKFYHLLILAVVSGLLITITLPVRGFAPGIFIGLVPLLLIEEHVHRNRERYRRGSFFLLMFIAFALWNSAGSWWLKNATLFGAIMAVLVNGLLMSLVFQLFHGSRRVFKRDSLAYLCLISFWIAFEYIHHNWDLTYPWFSLGNMFSSWPGWVQWYEYTGVLGGTLWILAGNIMIFLLARHLIDGRPAGRAILWKAGILGAWLAFPALFSWYLFANYDVTGAGAKEAVGVILVQPNNDPYTVQYSINPQTAAGNFLQLAMPLIDEGTDFIVGPESMIQENIWEGHFDKSPSIDSLRSFVGRHPALTVIAGASSFRMIHTDEPVTISARAIDPGFLPFFSQEYGVPAGKLSGWYDAYNLGLAVDTSGVTGMTHKSKLVAGVERMPFKKYLSSLVGDIAMDMGGTIGTLGIDEERFVFRHSRSGHKYGVAICYESVFGDFFSDFVRNGADMMFIITNDGWWGNTPGHRQHNAFASLRAIETRRDIARSANTGITCFINQRGEILQPTAYWVPDAIRGELHPNDRITFYVRYGDYIGRIALFLALALLIIRISYGIVPAHLRKSR